MKLKFKVQPYQTHAVESVVDCLAGQVNTAGIAYRIDPGVDKKRLAKGPRLPGMELEQTGFKNADMQLTDAQLKSGDGFALTSTSVETSAASLHSLVPYDLFAKIGESTHLTRQTIAAIWRLHGKN